MVNNKNFSLLIYRVFTLNNYDEKEEEEAFNVDWEQNKAFIKYLIVARERGESGTDHLQGYCSLRKPTRRAGLVKQLPFLQRAYTSKAIGTAEQNRVYCTKGGDFKEYGTIEQSGQRNDLLRIQNDIEQGSTLARIRKEHFPVWARFSRAIEQYYHYESATKERTPPSVFCFWGKTGTGKTRRVRDAETDLWLWPGAGWFDGYSGQDAALFDDFDGTQIPYRYLLQLLDRYGIWAPVKGGHAWFAPKRIYVTSNKHPREWYQLEDCEPLLRRFTSIEEIEQ